MKAKIEDHYAKDRRPLHSIVPVEEPLSFNIEPATFCNLKCNFCIYSCPKEEILKREHFFKFMSDETFELIFEQLKQFKQPLKCISFIGTGEPLLHKKLPEMIARIKKAHLAERVLLVTNGTLLEKSLVEKLMNAGIDTIKISINGLNAEDYYVNCGIKLDFEKFMNNLVYLYENKGMCEILIKTLTSVVGNREEEFYELYGNVCDKICVERTMQYFSEVNYTNLIDGEPSSRYVSRQKKVRICAAPFMRMGVRVDGNVTLCGCRVGISTENMDIRKNSLYNIWNGEEHRQVLLNVLEEKFDGITKDCVECTTRNDFAFEEDNLDPYVEEVYEKILKKRG